MLISRVRTNQIYKRKIRRGENRSRKNKDNIVELFSRSSGYSRNGIKRRAPRFSHDSIVCRVKTDFKHVMCKKILQHYIQETRVFL